MKDLLNRNIAEIIDRKNLESKLKSKRKLIIKFGRDPRTPTLHLGHSVPLRKLREFQLDGHEIVIVIGDFTAMLGDPADSEGQRDLVDQKVIKDNVSDLKKIFFKILDPKKTKFTYNSSWLAKLNLGDVVKLASNFSVQQNIERDLFANRIKAGKPVGLHEFMYPLMQGYDSVHLRPDLEVGGTDQTFNLLAGRTLMKNYGLTPQDILTVPMLIGTDGREMHSSWGNTINLSDEPFNMFGKLMSLRDELIITYLEKTTDLSLSEIDLVRSQLKNGKLSAIDAKKKLAVEVVTLYHGGDKARSALKQFEEVIQAKGIPEDRTLYSVGGSGSLNILDLLAESGLAKSRSEAKRLVDQGGVDEVHLEKGVVTSRTTLKEAGAIVKYYPGRTVVVQVGKRKAVEVTP